MADKRFRLVLKFKFEASSPEALADIARAVGEPLVAGDAVLLAGPVGVGKSHFARALIQYRLAALGRAEDVPSPSFTLVQTYDLEATTLWHVDLYRLRHADELVELGLEEAFADAICLVEWPERLAALRPVRCLFVELSTPTPHSENRNVVITLTGREWGAVADALRKLQPADRGGRS